jgi:hypothetical protein
MASSSIMARFAPGWIGRMLRRWGVIPRVENGAKVRPRSQSNKRNVNHDREDSTITPIGCSGDAAQVGLKPVARRRMTTDPNRCAGPAPEKGC